MKPQYNEVGGDAMPTSDQILNGLSKIANEWLGLAVLWHLYFGLLILAFVLGISPSKRVTATLLTLPILSVSVLAWMYANPFNGIVLGVAGLGLLLITLSMPHERVRISAGWPFAVGVLLTVFGGVYPHFLEGMSNLAYLYAAPTGLIPCPTLSIVTGLTLIFGGLGSRKWMLTLTLFGMFYGMFGALRLGVQIDWVLTLGALALLLRACSSTSITAQTQSDQT